MKIQIDPLLRIDGNGDVESSFDIGELFRDNRRRLVNLAFAITLDAGIAEEIVQDAFVGLQRKRGRVENPLGYLQRSVVNLGVTVIRRRRVISRQPAAVAAPPPASSPEIEEMWSRVQRLPPRQRAVVVLRYWDDLTIAEIAHVLRHPAGSVKSTLHRALKTLKEELP